MSAIYYAKVLCSDGKPSPHYEDRMGYHFVADNDADARTLAARLLAGREAMRGVWEAMWESENEDDLPRPEIAIGLERRTGLMSYEVQGTITVTPPRSGDGGWYDWTWTWEASPTFKEHG